MLEDENSQEYTPEDDLRSAASTASSAANTAVSNAPRVIRFTGKAVQFAGRGLQAVGTGMQALAPIPVVGWLSAGIGKGLTVFGKGVQVAGKGMEKGGQAAGKIKSGFGQAKSLGSIKNLASPTGLTSRAARLIPGPVGLALRIKDALSKLPIIGPLVQKLSDLLKKIAAGAALLTLYLLALLAAKLAAMILGAVAGAAIGFVIGGPVGAVVGGAIGAAFGPQIVSALSNYAGLAKSTTSAVGHGATSVVSGIGNAISSAFSSVGSFLSGAVGGTFGTLGAAANFLTSLGGLSLPTSFVSIPVFTTIGGLSIGTAIVTTIIAPAAFFTSEGELGTTPIPGQEEYFTLTKTADPTVVPNQTDGFATVQFTITLTAKNTRLTNVQLFDEIKGGPNGTISLPAPTLTCPQTIEPNTNCTQNFTATIDSRFNDSIVSNTIRVITTPEGQAVQTATVSALVRVGNPATTCPNRWPTDSGGNGITQGPQGQPGSSHYYLFPAEQALDIGVSFVPAKATFDGFIYDLQTNYTPGMGYGIYIDISGNCNGTPFRARWAHLSSLDGSLSIGNAITAGQTLGTTGSTGNSTGPHIHYSFFGLDMKSPYIPISPPPTCNDSSTCNVNW